MAEQTTGQLEQTMGQLEQSIEAIALNEMRTKIQVLFDNMLKQLPIDHNTILNLNIQGNSAQINAISLFTEIENSIMQSERDTIISNAKREFLSSVIAFGNRNQK